MLRLQLVLLAKVVKVVSPVFFLFSLEAFYINAAMRPAAICGVLLGIHCQGGKGGGHEKGRYT